MLSKIVVPGLIALAASAPIASAGVCEIACDATANSCLAASSVTETTCLATNDGVLSTCLHTADAAFATCNDAADAAASKCRDDAKGDSNKLAQCEAKRVADRAICTATHEAAVNTSTGSCLVAWRNGITSCQDARVTRDAACLAAGVACRAACPPPPGPFGDPCLGSADFSPGDESTAGPAPVCSPIILDLSGQGFSLTSAARGVLFDISGTGRPVRIAWTSPGDDDAFLALDRNGNGIVDDGTELFGNFTRQPGSAHPNGFTALAVFDDPVLGGNGDGVIDAQDVIFPALRLWVDGDHDGVCQPGELITLPAGGVYSLSLRVHGSMRRDRYGNVFRYRARVNPERDDPDSAVGRNAYDVFLTTTGRQ